MWTCFRALCVLVFGSVVWALPAKQARRDGGNGTLNGVRGDFSLSTVEIDGIEYYRNRSDVRWTFDIPEGSYVMLNSKYFDLEESRDCMFDSLTFEEDGLARKFCGYEHFVYISHSNNLNLHFASDASYEGAGFHLQFEVYDKAIDGYCNASIKGGANGKIYNTLEHCYTRIEATPGQFVRLNLRVLNFGSRSCEEESVKIYKGITTHGELVKTICSDDLPGLLDVSEEAFFIEYHRVSGIDDNIRFELAYSFDSNPLPTTPAPVTTVSPVGGDNDCSGFYDDIQGQTFIYEAPHFENNRECIVVIRAKQPKNHLHVIQVTFEDFELEYADDCKFDYLKIMSGEATDSQDLGGPYCGKSLNGRTFVTYGNSLRMEFKTDRSLSFYGLKAKIEFVRSTDCSCEGDNEVCVREGFEKRCLTGQRCVNNLCFNGGTCVETPNLRKCFCTNGFAGENCTERQDKVGQIYFWKAPRSRGWTVNSDILTECTVNGTGDLEASYVWKLNGKRISPYKARTGSGVYDERFLQIDNFDESWEGDYICEATVGNILAEYYFKYTLVERCLAELTVRPENTERHVGDSLVLGCKAEKSERVFWRKDGRRLNLDGRFSFLPATTALWITEAVIGDSGKYTCVAEDVNGCTIERSALLTIIRRDSHRDYCGKTRYPKPKVSQGTVAIPGENPWHVSLLSNSGNTVFCGGSIISKRYVLTAAHCVRSNHFEKVENVVIVFGTTKCKDKSADSLVNITRVIVHDHYNNKTFNNDIALIELATEINYGDYVRPVCLQSKDGYYDKVFFSSNAPYGKVAGCGKDTKTRQIDEMQRVLLPYISQEDCEETYEGITDITDNMFCAGFDKRYKGDVCGGDSGGAYVMEEKDRWYQTGIVSFGKDCDNQYYSVFTNVGNYYDWIRKRTNFDEEMVKSFR